MEETSSKEDASVVFLDRASRATRGKRMTKLLDDEIEEDELFWNQDALKEEENDNNYVEEAEVADEFDSDFDEDGIKRKREGEEKRMTQEEMLLEAAQTDYSYLEFSKGASSQSEISTTSVPYPGKAVCAVTELPAR
ncbi:hypothetical protein Pint_21444 [Pistacia integerrima]|uniref:Uncharacterized protein n=1 Tax=Pistacia integerrima TaxID=434235 RepID=A0ACC0XAN5_9ROSI|nr:hypothetical protein Pint_21444 [Pistacia integerrima]